MNLRKLFFQRTRAEIEADELAYKQAKKEEMYRLEMEASRKLETERLRAEAELHEEFPELREWKLIDTKSGIGEFIDGGRNLRPYEFVVYFGESVCFLIENDGAYRLFAIGSGKCISPELAKAIGEWNSHIPDVVPMEKRTVVGVISMASEARRVGTNRGFIKTMMNTNTTENSPNK